MKFIISKEIENQEKNGLFSPKIAKHEM